MDSRNTKTGTEKGSLLSLTDATRHIFADKDPDYHFISLDYRDRITQKLLTGPLNAADTVWCKSAETLLIEEKGLI